MGQASTVSAMSCATLVFQKVLTQFLLPKERTVKVVEVDYESVAYLREAYPQLEDNIIEDDFLKMNLQRLTAFRTDGQLSV